MIGRYNSTYRFVETNQLWGKDWEACDDVAQVEELINYLHPNKYMVSLLQNVKEDDIFVTEFKTISKEDLKHQSLHDKLQEAKKLMELIEQKEWQLNEMRERLSYCIHFCIGYVEQNEKSEKLFEQL